MNSDSDPYAPIVKLVAQCRHQTIKQRLVEGDQALRSRIYPTLVRRVFLNTLSNAYPIAAKIIGKDWQLLIDDFVRLHSCSAAELWHMPSELVDFCERYSWGKKKGYPFLADLLKFEWLEIELFMAADQSNPSLDADFDLMSDSFRLHTDVRLARFDYPVYLTTDIVRLESSIAEGCYLLGYRNPSDLRVYFQELSPLIYHGMGLLLGNETTGITGDALLHELLECFKLTDELDRELAKEALEDFLHFAQANGLLVQPKGNPI